MAITRAQQFRQMLIKGGVANPDGRRGFFQGALKDAREKNEPISPGTSVGGNTRGGTGKGRDLDVQQRGMTKSEYNKRVAEGTIDRYKGSDDPPKPPQLQEDKSFVPTPVPKGISPIERFRNDQIQKSINRNRVLALRKLGLLPEPSISPIGAIFQSFEQIPEEFELMSEEDLLKIATSGPYLSQQKTVGDVNRFTSGKDLLGRTFEAEDLLRKGDMTQGKFEELFPGPTPPPDDRGPDQQETDPCKGPNPPAYCFVNQPGDDPDDGDDDTNTGGLALRFRKDGGRIGADKGGIMKASYGYDDAMGEAFEEFLRLKKIKEIPEDMEFDEYLDQLDIDVPYSKKDKGEQRVMAQEGGMMDSPVGGIMDLETGRQMYFLGKLVKKASRALKKITKSPIGKAAILGGALYFGGGGGLPKLLSGKGLGGFSAKTFFSKANPLLFSKGELSLGKLAALSAASPFLFQEDEEEDQTLDRGPSLDIARIRNNPYDFLGRAFVADGGIMRLGYQEGSKEPVAKKTMPLLDMGGKEMDLRDNGGFVPIGRMEKADDVPARLSKNEFVFTAEAVRNAGEGDVDKGAEVMYNMMKNLEAGGEVSEESQGLEGARKMFQTSKRLEEVL